MLCKAQQRSVADQGMARKRCKGGFKVIQATLNPAMFRGQFANNTDRQEPHAAMVKRRTIGSASAAKASSTRSSAR